MRTAANTPTQPDRWTYLWLALGIVLLTLSTGQFRLAFAAWVAPAFLIRFFRSQKAAKGYLIIFLAHYVSHAISWRPVLAFLGPLPVFLVFVIFTALLNSLPFLADRLLAPRIKGFAATLVYPLAVTALFLLYNLVSPMGSFGTPGYEQYNNLALIQLVSVTGLWGLTFLVNWCGPVVNWAWERKFTWAEVRGGLLLFASVVGCVLLFGGLRLAFARQVGSVRIHSFTPQSINFEQDPEYAKDSEAYRRFSQEVNEAFLAGTVAEARRGAQIVVWPEMAGGGVEQDANALIARARQVAQQEGIYLVMGLAIYYPGQDRPWENKAVIIAPSGEIILDHDKFGATILYGMMGAGEALQGEYRLQVVESPFGALTAVVCWDADFPITIRQAGKQKADILFVGTGDPTTGPVTVLHAQQHIFRAIENGFSLVRHESHNGLSVAADPYGRVLAMVDINNAAERVMVAQVPTDGVFTLYSVIGDLFGWLSVAGFVMIAGWAIFGSRKAGVRS